MLCFVLVDDRNLRVADFAQFWASAKVYSVSLNQAMWAFLPVFCFSSLWQGILLEFGADNVFVDLSAINCFSFDGYRPLGCLTLIYVANPHIVRVIALELLYFYGELYYAVYLSLLLKYDIDANYFNLMLGRFAKAYYWDITSSWLLFSFLLHLNFSILSPNWVALFPALIDCYFFFLSFRGWAMKFMYWKRRIRIQRWVFLGS